MNKIKSCPFCRSNKINLKAGYELRDKCHKNSYFVKCDSCGSRNETFRKAGLSDEGHKNWAIEDWNLIDRKEEVLSVTIKLNCLLREYDGKNRTVQKYNDGDENKECCIHGFDVEENCTKCEEFYNLMFGV